MNTLICRCIRCVARSFVYIFNNYTVSSPAVYGLTTQKFFVQALKIYLLLIFLFIYLLRYSRKLAVGYEVNEIKVIHVVP